MDSSTHSEPGRRALAERLRHLRRHHWPDNAITQHDLAAALGIRASNISAWESSNSSATPTPQRLGDIATFFSTRRSPDRDSRRLLLPLDELDDAERAHRSALLAELTALLRLDHDEAVTEHFHPWRFADGAAVRLVCGRRLGATDAFADPTNHNFMALSHYADADALMELYGQLRAKNPESDVQYRLVDELTSEDLQGHLVVLGNLSRMQDDHEIFAGLDLPVRQVETELDGEVFELRRSPGAEPERVLPDFVDGRYGHLLTDIGFFARQPSPLNYGRTLSLCSGVFTRGVVGVARLTSDPIVGQSNLDWLSAHFSSATSYGLLVRVPVRGRHLVTPDLSTPGNRILAFTRVGNTVQVIA